MKHTIDTNYSIEMQVLFFLSEAFAEFYFALATTISEYPAQSPPDIHIIYYRENEIIEHMLNVFVIYALMQKHAVNGVIELEDEHVFDEMLAEADYKANRMIADYESAVRKVSA